MACLNHWYSCEDWLCGGQWKEYMNVLKRWVEAFTVAGIRLVFFFDGVVNEQKRRVWVRTETANVVEGFFPPAASKNCIKCRHIHVVVHILLWCQEWFSTLTWRTKLLWSSSFSRAVLHMPSSFLMSQVKRRQRVNGEISKIFRYVKSHGRQPGRHLSCLPSGLASFTSFALRLALEDQQRCSGSPQ